ncbi:MAG: outer membrane lipoprotein-sorting protein [Thermodesulfobacteriota bacterium]
MKHSITGYCRTAVALGLGLLFIQVAPLHAQEAEEIIRRVVDNLNGETAIMEISMVVKTRRAERRMKMKSYSVGQEKSFIRVSYPKKDEGITFLKIDNAMWQYVPRIEKVIKIPASMMLQSWMGSDFTNDDLVKESSLSEDYLAELLGETEEEYSLALHPRPEAPVVWGKIVMSVSKKYHLPLLVSYFDEEDVLIRELLYTDITPYGKRFYPSHWVMTPRTPDKEGHATEIIVSEVIFDGEVDEAYFSKRALKRFSN